MPITSEQIFQISELARIKIDRDQTDLLTEKIGEIISFVGQLKNVETDNIDPLYNPLDAIQKLRPDVVTETDQRERFLGIAPSVEENLFSKGNDSFI